MRATKETPCTKCTLSTGCKSPCMKGTGNENSPPLMFIGQAPGKEEDISGVPFMGKVGKLLNFALAMNKIPRDNCYFTNAVRCFPPNDRRPHIDEIKACWQTLAEEIVLVRPKAIVLLGEVAKQSFAMHANQLPNCPPVFAMIHPAAALRAEFAEREFHTGMLAAARFYKTGYTPGRPVVEVLSSQPVSCVGDPTSKTFEAFPGLPEFYNLVWSLPEPIALDIETTGLDCQKDAVIGVGFTAPNSKVYYLDFKSVGSDNYLKPFQYRHLVLHNAAFDLRFLRHAGLEISRFDDTMLMHALLFSHLQHGLKELGYIYADNYGWEREIVQYPHIWDAPLHVLANYCGNDAFATLQVWQKLSTVLRGSPKLQYLYETVVLPQTCVLMDVMDSGVKVNKKTLLAEHLRLSEELIAQERLLNNFPSVSEYCARQNLKALNPRSSKQVSGLLFGGLGLKAVRKTKSGKVSTDKESLEFFNTQETDCIMVFRKLSRDVEVVADIKERLNNDSILSCTYRQDVVVSGRLTSSEPNLQNIDRQSGVRKAVVSRFPGGKLVAADYSQDHIRVMAALSKDPQLLACCESGEDIYREIAAKVYGSSPEEVTSEARHHAKTAVLGIAFGLSVKMLSIQLKITEKSAGELLFQIFDRFPLMREMFRQYRSRAEQKGYVKSRLGRVRILTGIYYGAGWRQINHALLQAGNFPIQSPPADMIAYGLVKVAEYLYQYNLRSRIVLLNHDEIVLDSPAHEVRGVVTILRHALQHDVTEWLRRVYDFNVSLGVDIAIGEHWGELG